MKLIHKEPVIDSAYWTGRLDELTAAARQLPFRLAEYEAGRPGARVYQEFGYCGAVPAGQPVRRLGRWFEARLRIVYPQNL